MSAPAFDAFLSTPEMLAIFGETAFVQAMMDFEAALSRAQADEGLIPSSAAGAIVGVCKAELYDVSAIVAASPRAGSLAIPMVKKLTETVGLFDVQAAGYVHWGSTSQDVIDTAMVLCLRRAMALIDRDLVKLVEGLLALARRDGDAPMLARTLMQPAQVVSLGLKMVAWIAPLVRIHERLRAKAEAALQLQLGGAVGTLAVMGAHAPRVAERMAQALQLRLPVGAWHTQRDELMTLACELGVLAAALGKIARDISLLAQGEVGELSEPVGPGRGGSSAMPHKRNPVAAMVALAGALRAPLRVAALLEAMVQEHERGLGNWQAELGELAGLCQSAHGALKALAEVADGLVVHRERMHENIERTQGLVFAEAVAAEIAHVIGKPRAHALMERLSQQAADGGASLRELTHAALDGDAELRPHLAHERIEALFDPARAADRAREVAQPQLAVLAARARALSATAPWAAWLNA